MVNCIFVINTMQAQLAPNLICAATGIPFTMGSNALQTVVSDPFGRSTNRQTSVTVSSKTYQYDANGSLTNDSRQAYYWGDENRLVEVRRNGETIQRNRYDGLGRRREKIEAAITHRYIYKDWLVLAITDGAESMLKTYTHGADLSGHLGGGAGGIGGILSSTQNDLSTYYHYDFNGNIVQVSASNQLILAKYTYSPFGEILLKEGYFMGGYQFSTKESDAPTKLTYYGYRFYSPALGRWVSNDTHKEMQFQNLQRFAKNSPTLYFDHLGLWDISDCKKAANLQTPSGYAENDCTNTFEATISVVSFDAMEVACFEAFRPTSDGGCDVFVQLVFSKGVLHYTCKWRNFVKCDNCEKGSSWEIENEIVQHTEVVESEKFYEWWRHEDVPCAQVKSSCN